MKRGTIETRRYHNEGRGGTTPFEEGVVEGFDRGTRGKKSLRLSFVEIGRVGGRNGQGSPKDSVVREAGL